MFSAPVKIAMNDLDNRLEDTESQRYDQLGAAEDRPSEMVGIHKTSLKFGNVFGDVTVVAVQGFYGGNMWTLSSDRWNLDIWQLCPLWDQPSICLQIQNCIAKPALH
ncbi:hypothetical protein N7517_001422 [Penicillium concentricum]|uniref:Uncharacterized protein n=1 Tax=Penicillium concentricum TaxID=293559 RepID=A0A9W9SS93_9EURO|nr:uncharacterized protein N7517_001422 [Penicillium concentricum]KAJ5383511.1 hypothetical protein N7517_001422 [Penicillium concentricum]